MTAPTYHLDIHTTPRTDRTLVAVTGEVDVTNVDAFATAVTDIPSPHQVILDISDLRYLDSAGFAALDELLARDRILVVLAPGSHLRTAADLVGLPYHDTIDTALATRN